MVDKEGAIQLYLCGYVMLTLLKQHIIMLTLLKQSSLVAQMVQNLPAVHQTWFDSWVGKIPWRRAWQPTPEFLPGESPWTEEPGGLSPWGRNESDTTEQLSAAQHSQFEKLRYIFFLDLCVSILLSFLENRKFCHF